MKITVLNENHVNKRGLFAEHGLSLLLEQEEEKWLFDTGQSDVYLKNAKTLKQSLETLQGIILSHGHYDHCGGLEYFDKKMPKVYIRKEALYQKMSGDREKNTFRDIGIPWKKEMFSREFIFTEEMQKIRKNWFLLGKIPKYPGLEEEPEGFWYRVREEIQKDTMEDEQFLVIQTEKGLVLIIGCAHMGILNCIQHVKTKFPGKKIRGIFAGMHMRNATEEKIDWTIQKLKEEKLEFLIGAHCTGQKAIGKMAEMLGECFQFCEVGKIFEFI